MDSHTTGCHGWDQIPSADDKGKKEIPAIPLNGFKFFTKFKFSVKMYLNVNLKCKITYKLVLEIQFIDFC